MASAQTGVIRILIVMIPGQTGGQMFPAQSMNATNGSFAAEAVEPGTVVITVR
jgi:hypothetical protein